jgi:multiple sugar transport system permease protein
LNRANTLFLYILTASICISFFFPVFWMVSASFKKGAVAWSIPPVWPFPTLDNYRYVLFETNFFTWFTNSMIVCTMTTIVTLLLGVPAAYSLSRFRIKGSENMLFFVLSTRMGPPIAFAIPFYIIFLNANLIDNLVSLIILYTIMNISLVVWITKGFFDGIPKQIEQSAMLDGLTRFEAFRTFALPLAAEGIFTAAIFTFIFSWNEFFYANIFTSTHARTLPPYMLSFIKVKTFLWGEMCAAATLITIPVIILIVIVHRYLVRGLTMGMIE